MAGAHGGPHLNSAVRDLADDVFVGEADYEPVLVGVILVLVLLDQAQASAIVCLALPPPAVLDLQPSMQPPS